MGIVEVDDVPQEWGLIAGDAFTNFRAALDYAAWQMVKAGTDSNPRREEDVYFPIYRDSAQFDRLLLTRLPGVREEQIAIVRRHQPYQWEASGAGLAVSHPLARLAELSRLDKHRRLVVLLTKNVRYEFRITRIVGWTRDRVEVPSGNLSLGRVGTELLRIYGRPTGEDIEVELDFGGEAKIAFETGAAVGETLDEIERAITMILEELAPLF